MERRAFLRRVRTSRPVEGPTAARGSSTVAPMPPTDAPGVTGACVSSFTERLTALGVHGRTVRSTQDLRTAITELVKERSWACVASAAGLRWPDVPWRWTRDAREADLGLSEATWAVAETGTVVVQSSPEEQRSSSLLPSAVGFVVRQERLLPRVDDLLAALAASGAALPSCVTLVTGPSNTADIASVHVVGVHGPGEVFVWLLREDHDPVAVAESDDG